MNVKNYLGLTEPKHQVQGKWLGKWLKSYNQVEVGR